MNLRLWAERMLNRAVCEHSCVLWLEFLVCAPDLILDLQRMVKRQWATMKTKKLLLNRMHAKSTSKCSNWARPWQVENSSNAFMYFNLANREQRGECVNMLFSICRKAHWTDLWIRKSTYRLLSDVAGDIGPSAASSLSLSLSTCLTRSLQTLQASLPFSSRTTGQKKLQYVLICCLSRPNLNYKNMRFNSEIAFTWHCSWYQEREILEKLCLSKAMLTPSCALQLQFRQLQMQCQNSDELIIVLQLHVI